jgi:hypothetical protein
MIEKQSMKTDFYIKLASEADMPTVLSAFYRQDSTTVVDPDTGEEHVQLEGEPYLVSTTHDYAIDLVGVIYEPTGVTLTDAEGNEWPETAPLDSWHLNIRLLNDTMREAVEAIDATYGVTPSTPSRVWA